MADAPSVPWTLSCPWCDWKVIVNARGQRRADPGSGVETAHLAQEHARTHGRTWNEFLSVLPPKASP